MSNDFLFGAATASHQVEGNTHNDWTEWELRNAKEFARRAAAKTWPDYILNSFPNPLQEENYISGRACDHYHRFPEDFDIARSLGHTAHRFSIEWSRVEPEEGKFDEREIAHYRNVVAALRERGMEPFVTLWHWTLPIWLAEKGGILSREFPGYFSRYAERIVGALPDVAFWMTMNEPEILALNGCVKKRWPPQKQNLFLFWRVVHRLAAAHQSARAAMKKMRPDISVGATSNVAFYESAGGLVNECNAHFMRYWNTYFLRKTRRDMDFIGLNYYFHNKINYGLNRNENKSMNDMGWEIYPEGIYHVLNDLKKYKLPIYITENGLPDIRDEKRAQFIGDHLLFIKKAMNEGVDVRGYLYWSLLDNFEWDSGFWPRFGLVEVDYRTLERKIRPSALVYKKIIETWQT